MIDRDSTQSAPLAPPHYELLSHPLIHDPHSPSYLSCLDILHNAEYLVDLFKHLNLDETSDRGGISTNAADAFFWQAKMLGDTLRYVSLNLKEAWAEERKNYSVDKKLRQSVFLKAMQKLAEKDKPYIYNIMASCLSIDCADVEMFIAMAEEQ